MILIVSNTDRKDFIKSYRCKFYFRDYCFIMPYSGSHSALYFVSSLFVLHTQEQKYIPISPFSLFEEVSSGLPVKTGKHYTSNHKSDTTTEDK